MPQDNNVTTVNDQQPPAQFDGLDDVQMFIGQPRYTFNGGNWLAMVWYDDCAFFEKLQLPGF